MVTDTSERESVEELKRRFEQAVFLIGVGLRDKDSAFEKDPHKYPYSSNFRHGLNMFAALCAEHAGDNAARILNGMSESRFIRDFCTRSVVSWTDYWSEQSRAAIQDSTVADVGPLAIVEDDIFMPSDECLELTHFAEDDTVGAYQERQVYNYLSSGTQEQYVAGRRFLIRHPLLSWDEFQAAKTGRCIPIDDPLDQGEASQITREWLGELLKMAYEISPNGLKICPRCGWTMSKRGSQLYCSSAFCQDGLSTPYEELPPVPHDARRLANGVMRYISRPGTLELDIATAAKVLGLSFELWPQKDACDVLVTLPDGAELALDAKMYINTHRLMREIENDTTADSLGADEVIYVIPDDTEARQPGACALCNKALISRSNYSCCTLKQLIKRMTDAVKEGSNGR